MIELIQKWLSELDWTRWAILGFAGQLIFGCRFFVQWIASERKGESVIPISFWWLSIVGSLMLLTYAIIKKEPVFILAYLFNCIPYVRNLMLIQKKAKLAAAAAAAAAATDASQAAV